MSVTSAAVLAGAPEEDEDEDPVPVLELPPHAASTIRNRVNSEPRRARFVILRINKSFLSPSGEKNQHGVSQNYLDIVILRMQNELSHKVLSNAVGCWVHIK